MLKVPTDKGILSLRGNILMARTAESDSYAAAEVEDIKAQLAKTKLATLEVNPVQLEIPEHSARRASATADNPKRIKLTNDDPTKTALIGQGLDPK